MDEDEMDDSSSPSNPDTLGGTVTKLKDNEENGPTATSESSESHNELQHDDEDDSPTAPAATNPLESEEIEVETASNASPSPEEPEVDDSTTTAVAPAPPTNTDTETVMEHVEAGNENGTHSTGSDKENDSTEGSPRDPLLEEAENENEVESALEADSGKEKDGTSPRQLETEKDNDDDAVVHTEAANDKGDSVPSPEEPNTEETEVEISALSDPLEPKQEKDIAEPSDPLAEEETVELSRSGRPIRRRKRKQTFPVYSSSSSSSSSEDDYVNDNDNDDQDEEIIIDTKRKRTQRKVVTVNTSPKTGPGKKGKPGPTKSSGNRRSDSSYIIQTIDHSGRNNRVKPADPLVIRKAPPGASYEIIIPSTLPNTTTTTIPSGPPKIMKVTSLNKSYRPGPLQKKPLDPPDPASKICLLCLRQYIEKDLVDDEIQVIEVVDPKKESDPLLDAVVKANYISSVEKAAKEAKQRRMKVYLSFLKIVSRHLQVKTKRLRTAAETHKLLPPFCGECFHFIDNLCEKYNQWEVARMSIRWRLTQISNAIKLSNSRASGKLGYALFKSLAEQIHMLNGKVTDQFRRQLSLRCTIKAKTVPDVPAVSIDKEFCAKYAESKLKYPIQEMVGYLKSLIVVFALASPHKDKPPEPKSKKGSLRKKGDENMSTSDIVRREKGSNDEEVGNKDGDDHFGGGSPPASPGGPASPIQAEDEALNGSDTDWEANAGPDVTFSVRPSFYRRMNLRTRRSGNKLNEGETDAKAKADKTTPAEEEKKFACNICSRSFNSDSSLKAHLSRKHDFIFPYSCGHCSQRFKLRKFLDAHVKEAHPTIKPAEDSQAVLARTCTFCQKVFPTKAKMLIHRKKTHKRALMATYTCEICEKVVLGNFRYERHLKAHDRNPEWGDGLFKCEVAECGRVFSKESCLKSHMSLHVESFSCSACDKVFTELKEIRSHLINEHENNKDKPHPCLFCDKEFTLKQTHEFHVKVLHANQIKLDCDMEACTEEFDSPEELREHLKSVHLPPDIVEVMEKVEQGGIFFINTYTNNSNVNAETTDGNDAAVPPPAVVSINPVTESVTADVFKRSDSAEVEGTGTGDVEKTAQMEENPENAENISENNSAEKRANDDTAPNAATENKENCTAEKESEKSVNVIDTDPLALGLFTCEKCRWSFSTRFALSFHMVTHTKPNGKGNFSCKLCSKPFRSIDGLQTHYNSEHGPNIKPILCKTCGQRFHRKEGYYLHLKSHKKKELEPEEDQSFYLCSECGESCDSKIAYQRHMKTHSPGGGKVRVRTKTPGRSSSAGAGGRTFPCDQCDEIFRGSVKLKIHQSKAHGMDRPFKCDAEGCTKSFLSRDHLKKHQIIHGDATFLCPECPKTFFRQTGLENHLLVHKGEKNHICDVCGKAFLRQQALQIHLAIHTGDKKFQCQYCDKTFLRKNVLDSHVRTHTKEKPFPCRICGESFSQYTSRKAHEDRHKRLNTDQPLPVRRRRRDNVADTNIVQKRKTRRLKGRKGKNKLENSNEESDKTENVVQTPSDSGIIHEALRAAFGGDGTEIPDELLASPTGATYSPSSSLSEHGKEDLLNSIEVVVQLNEDGNRENQTEETPESTPAKGKKRKGRGRAPKQEEESNTVVTPTPPLPSIAVTNDLTCGFCGKQFQRERAYKLHVEKHLTEDSVLGNHTPKKSQHKTDTEAIQQTGYTRTEQPQQQQNYQAVPPQLTAVSGVRTRRSQTMANSPAPPNLEPAVMESEPPPKKRKGRPPGKGNNSKTEPPGSRLARIVQDVMETATHAQSYNTRRSMQQQQTAHQQYHQQYPNESPPSHNMMHSQTPSPHPHQYQSPSPHEMNYSGSERSTPTMSSMQGQSQQHHYQGQQGQYVQPQSALYQQGTTANQQQNNYAQYQFLLQNQNSANVTPQDLSKGNYSMFFANPR